MTPGYFIRVPSGRYICFFHHVDWVDACCDYAAAGFRVCYVGPCSRRLEARS